MTMKAKVLGLGAVGRLADDDGPRYAVIIVASGLIGLEVGAVFLLTSMTLSVTADFRLGSMQQGLLMSMTALGGLAGSMIAGHLADRQGRRLPVLFSLALTALFSFLASQAAAYHCLVLLGAALGFGLGIGLVPVSVLLSETTPEGSRMICRGVCQCIGGVSGFLMLVAVYFDDVSLRHLHWRLLLRGLSLAAVGLLAFACCSLGESPRLAGRAWTGLDGCLRPSSGSATVLAPRTCYRRPSRKVADFDSELSLAGQVRVIFSGPLRATTIYITFGAFIAGLVQGGHQYALPQILSKEMHMLNPAAARMVICCFGVPMAPAAVWTASRLPRRGALAALAAAGVIVALATALLGTWRAPQTQSAELLFYMAMSLDPYRAFLAGLLFGEIGADAFPATAAGFGASLVAVSVGVATIGAPLLFEALLLWTGSWAIFYYAVTGLLLFFLLVTWLAAPSVEAYSDREPGLLGVGASEPSGYGALWQLQL